MALINFFSEELEFKPSHPKKTAQWIKNAVDQEKKEIKLLNIIFCTDEYLYGINREYLNHKTLTDIVTFDQSDDPNFIEGDIFISIQRVHDNASKFNTVFDEELHRVIIHGVLHLIGYDDKSETKKKVMRKKEDAYLSLR